MKTELVKASDFGISEDQEKQLTSDLPQILKEREELIPQYNSIIKMDIEDPATAKKAREVRLLIQKNRTQKIVAWHKSAKDYFLKGGQFVDSIKRKEIGVNERMESDLLEIEKHAEIKERKRLEALQLERAERLSVYVKDANDRDLKKFENDEFEALLFLKKKEHEERIAAEKKAEEERIAAEKAAEEERKRIQAENEKLIREAEERERIAKIEADKRANEEAERKAKEEAERKIREEKERKEKAAYEAKLKAEREAREKVEREELEKREKLEAELKAKAEAERKAKAEEEARLQAELNKGDSVKVKDLINDLNALKTKYSFKSAKNQKRYEDVKLLIDKVINHIEK